MQHIRASRKQFVIFLALIFNLFISNIATAHTYYVSTSKSSASDSNNGLNPSRPWKTISKVNSEIFNPGDSVLFRCGDTWREELNVPSSGTASQPVTFGSYGNCNNNKPLIIGSDIVNNWSSYSGYKYVSSLALIAPPDNLVENGSLDINAEGWWQYGSVSYTWTGTNCVGTGGCIQASIPANSTGSVSTKRFILEPGIEYHLQFSAKASTPVDMNASFNLDTTPSNVATYSYSADTNWTTYSFDFTPNANLQSPANVRVDFKAPTNASSVQYYIDDVVLKPVSTIYDDAKQIYVDGNYVNLAQWPNNPDAGNSNNTYELIAQSTDPSKCPAPQKSPTSSLISQADPTLTNEASDIQGAGIHIRTTHWIIDDNTVTGFDPSTNTITLTNPTEYSICEGWGYYLDNKLWMLDIAGEWYYDTNSRQLYAWMPDNGVPGTRVEAAHRNGINAVARANIVIDGLSIDEVGDGIDMQDSENITVQNTDINNVYQIGIDAHNSINTNINTSSIQNTVRTGINLDNSTSATVSSNTLTNIGTVGSPKRSLAAIASNPSESLLITGNYIQNSGYNGISGDRDFSITQNIIHNPCQVLDDCGAIYIGGKSNYSENGIISNNIIAGAGSPSYGEPATISMSQGIYLDSHTDHVTVSGNTISDTDYGLQIHDADTNSILNNTIYASRQWPVYMSENAEGGVSQSGTTHDNTIKGNSMFPISTDGTYSLYGAYGSIDFAQYDNNRYSALYGTSLIKGSMNTSGGTTTSSYTLATWQDIGNDQNSTQFNLFSIASTKIVSVDGNSIINDGSFDTDPSTIWGAYLGTNYWEPTCVVGSCLQFTRTSTSGGGLAHSNRFSIQKGQSYVLSFDLRSDFSNLPVSVVTREASGSYSPVGPNAKTTLAVDQAWQRYNIPFTASETLTYDPSVGGSGARTDFVVSTTGADIYIDNVSLVPVTLTVNDPSDDSILLTNDSTDATQYSCPNTIQPQSLCQDYVQFSDGTPVSWPLTINAMSSDIVIWTTNPMRDSDGDGIPDVNDTKCPSTPANTPVGMDGCSFAEEYP